MDQSVPRELGVPRDYGLWFIQRRLTLPSPPCREGGGCGGGEAKPFMCRQSSVVGLWYFFCNSLIIEYVHYSPTHTQPVQPVYSGASWSCVPTLPERPQGQYLVQYFILVLKIPRLGVIPGKAGPQPVGLRGGQFNKLKGREKRGHLNGLFPYSAL